jgi:hypothetical protein
MLKIEAVGSCAYTRLHSLTASCDTATLYLAGLGVLRRHVYRPEYGGAGVHRLLLLAHAQGRALLRAVPALHAGEAGPRLGTEVRRHRGHRLLVLDPRHWRQVGSIGGYVD